MISGFRHYTMILPVLKLHINDVIELDSSVFYKFLPVVPITLFTTEEYAVACIYHSYLSIHLS